MRALAWAQVLLVASIFLRRGLVKATGNFTVCHLGPPSEKCAYYDQDSAWSECMDGLRERNVTALLCEYNSIEACEPCESSSGEPLWGACGFDETGILQDGNQTFVETQNCTVPSPPPPPPSTVPPPPLPVPPPPSPAPPPADKPWKVCDALEQYLQIELETFGSTLRTLNTHGDFFLQTLEKETNSGACYSGSPGQRSHHSATLLKVEVLLFNITEEHAAALMFELKRPDYLDSITETLKTKMEELTHITALEWLYVSPASDSESSKDPSPTLPGSDTDIKSNKSRVGALLVVLLPIAAAMVVLAAAGVYVYRIRRSGKVSKDKYADLDPADVDGPQPMIFASYSDNPVHHHSKRCSSESSGDRLSFLEKFKRRFHTKGTVVPGNWHQDCVDDVCMRFNVGLQSVNESMANMFPSISDELKSCLLPSIKDLSVEVGGLVSFIHGHVYLVVPGEIRLPSHKIRKLLHTYRKQSQDCRHLLHTIEDTALEQCIGLVHHAELIQGLSVLRGALDTYDRLLQHTGRT